MVDLAFAKQQAKAGLYTWASTQKLLAGIVSIIEHIEMPKRDGETKTMWEALQLNRVNVFVSTRPTCASVTWPL